MTFPAPEIITPKSGELFDQQVKLAWTKTHPFLFYYFPGFSNILVERGTEGTYISKSGRIEVADPNTPRIIWYNRDGDEVPEPYLLLEPAATNLLLQSSNVGPDSSPWGGTEDFSITPAVSIIAGQTAWRHTNAGLATSRYRNQSAGQFGSGPQTAYLIVENVDAADTALNIRDLTAGVNLCVGRLRWATGEASVLQGTGAVRAEKLADAGPNGGPVYLLAVTATSTPGNARWIFLYPTGTPQNTQTAIIHHVQLEEQPLHTSPIVTTTAAVTRAADVLTFPWSHPPQAMTGYLRFVERGAIAYSDTRVLLQIGTGGVQPRLLVAQQAGEGRYRVFLSYGAGVASVLPATPVPVIGDRVELLWRLYADGSVQIEQAINGGAPVVAARSAAIGLPTAWSGQVMRLSGVPNGGSEAPAAWRDAIVLRGSNWTMEQVREVISDLDWYRRRESTIYR